MDYNTERIAEIAQQVAQAFQAAVVAHQQANGAALTIADVETGLREFLRQVGMQSLSQFLSTGAGTPAAELPCPCGAVALSTATDSQPHDGVWLAGLYPGLLCGL